MIRKLNNYFFVLEENESIGVDGSLFYLATAGCLVVTALVGIVVY